MQRYYLVAVEWWRTAAVVATLLLVAVLAIVSLLGDSITYDEPQQLTAGFSNLTRQGYHLTAASPPLVGMWASLPLIPLHPRWPPLDSPGWHERSALEAGRAWLFDLNDGERLIPVARCMMVILLLLTCAITYV